jgi:hypothetical protein
MRYRLIKRMAESSLTKTISSTKWHPPRSNEFIRLISNDELQNRTNKFVTTKETPFSGQRALGKLLRCCLALVALSAVVFAADDAPAWLRQAAASSAPAYDKYVPGVVLLKEQQVTIGDDGRVTTTERGAIKILTREGRDYADAAVSYITETGKVRDMRAWLIRPSGEVKKYGKEQTLDLAIDNDVYNEVRTRVISAGSDADAGAIFGYEWTSEDRSVFIQFDWEFQRRLPVVVSRCTFVLPSGWRAESVTFNHARVEPAVSGSTYSWELRHLPPIEPEPFSPEITNLAPRLAINIFPSGGKGGMGKTFDSWAEVSRWLSSLSDTQAELNDALAGKARELTAHAKTELEKLQAIGRYAQSVHYIAIQTGIGRGGGYRPHSAIDVFTKSYGDCKDKANLMRAMLKALRIPAYLVSIYSGDPTYVREEWPSPQQFNHCIVAVKVNDETEAATIVKHPSLGRLLIFDPTDEYTPVGDLPDHEQGSLALVVAGDAGALLRMPVTSPEANRLERQIEATLGADGTITATVRERSAGHAATAERQRFRRLSRPEYVKMIESWITRGATGASVSKIEPADESAAGRFALDVEFTAARYGQLMQDRLMVFKPAIVSRRESLSLTEAGRKHPVVLKAQGYTETARVKLPAGFVVDEVPDAAKLDAPFGNYTTSYEVKDGQLIFTRSLTVRAATIPVEQYTQVRSFFERIRAAEQAPVVIIRK